MNNDLKYLHFLFVLVLFFSSVIAVKGQGEDKKLFNNLKVKDGLPSNEVFEIEQDSLGFMWFATNNGFVRYDGYNMAVFRKDRQQEIALPNNQVTCIENTNDLGLWIGSYEGLIYFNTKNVQSEAIDLGGTREIRCLLNQGDSIIWAGSAEGLFKINCKDYSYHLYNQKNSALGSDIVRSLYLDIDQNLWIGTFNGLNVLDPWGNMQHFNLKENYKLELKNNLVLDIQPYVKNNDSLLWIGTETGLVLFNTISFKYEVFNIENTNFENEVIKCIFSKNPGYVYVGTDLGFYFLNTFTKEIEASFHDPFNNYSISNNVVWDIYEDNSGVLWLATSNGISKLNFNQSMFRFTPVYAQNEKQITGTQVNDIYSDKNNTVWLATKKGVLALHPDGERESFTSNGAVKNRLVLNNINTISGDYLGRIWIGSAGGINIWDPKNKKMQTITANFDLNQGLRSNYISAFISPPDGSFWVTTWGGGMYKAVGDFSNLDNLDFEYVANFNTNVFSTAKKIWLTNENKIFSIDLNTQQIETSQRLNEYISKDNVTSILATSKGFLWIGIHNILLKYNVQNEEIEEFEVFTGNDSYLLNLVEDHNGNIWGTTLTSIFKFAIGTNAVETFPKNEGIPLDNFLYESKAIAADGKLFFGGNDGYISFEPNKIRKNTFNPNTVITELRVNNKPIQSLNELGGKNKTENQITYSPKVTLRYDQHSFVFGFATLHYGDPERNIYAHQLEGFDEDWKYTSGAENFASYSNLSSGKYIFKVKGTNNDGVWFDEITTLKVNVKPPTWASPLAIIIYIITLQVLLILLISTYRNKVRWKEKIRIITLEKEKNEELARSKQQFFTNISHEFRTPLSLILGPVESILKHNNLDKHNNQLLNLISKNAQRLYSLVNQLLDLRKIEMNTLQLKLEETDLIEVCQKQYNLFIDLAESKNIHFTFHSSINSVKAKMDLPKFESILQNLLSNAFKFTPSNGKVSLSIAITDASKISIQVQDTGKGIDENTKPNIFKRFYQANSASSKTTGYGIGLNIAKEYCELMQGAIRFESEENKGATFYVEIPLNLIEEIPEHPSSVESLSLETVQSKKLEQTIITQSNQPVLLLVDDHPDALKYLQISLKADYRILLASNGKEAFQLLEKQKVDLIISDLMMPELDGIQFCEMVKDHPKYENIPIILLTAKTLDDQKIEGYQAGTDAYLTKPFDLNVLKAQIHSLIIKSKKIDEYIKRKLIVENQEIEVESADEKLLQETIKFINDHLSDPDINLEKMCKSIGVSHSSLYRKIKAQTGMTLNELIRNTKLKKAAQLIKTERLTIAEIMSETGFTNHSYFAKCFKKVYKLSPREYGHIH